MSVSIRPLHPVFVGEIAGIDCRHPLDAGEVAAIENGMDRYAVLVFREQSITDDEQLAFTRHFGELEAYRTPGHVRPRSEQRLGPGMADFSNLDKHGNIIRCCPRACCRPGAATPISLTCAPPMTRSIRAPSP